MSKVKWKSQAEIDEEEYLKSLEPSDENVKKAQLELVVLNLLVDMEVVQ